MSEETFTASLYPGSKLTIDSFTGGSHPTPGNVGICLCGGGSRALSAGMGQLRALNHLRTDKGKSLLSQTKAVSTVSGGSWLGITFEYQDRVSDEAFLNKYVNPSDLTANMINHLPEGNIGEQVTTGFTIIDIAILALLLYIAKIPADMLWQTVIGWHILSPYRLYNPFGKNQAFSYEEETVQQILKMRNQNPTLSEVPFSTLSSNGPRPYFICNTAMFVEDAEPKEKNYQYLAPVQCTPFFTGIVGNPGGTDANGKKPGGGGVTSFAFNSVLKSFDNSLVRVDEQRPWSIMDCVGASSAAFSETIINALDTWKSNPKQFLLDMRIHGDRALSVARENLDTRDSERAAKWLTALSQIDVNSEKLSDQIVRQGRMVGNIQDVLSMLASARALVPKYNYWPVAGAAPDSDIHPTHFADGGNLENTGVASLLSYSDIDNVISFINSSTLLSPATAETPPSVERNESSGVISTKILVDGQIPPLFGYQPYSESDGTYTPYNGGSNISKETAWGVHNQVFPCGAFTDFLSGIWRSAWGSRSPAIFRQQLSVVENEWFGVAARESICCVWVYTSTVTDWENLLKDEVKAALHGLNTFPNYSTLNTELTPAEINLLSNLSAWSVANDNNKALFIDLYQN